MRDDAWLNRIRHENRKRMGLEGVPMSQAVLDAPGTRSTPWVSSSGHLQGMSGSFDAFSLGGVVGAGLALLGASLVVAHKPRTKKRLALAGVALLAFAAVKGRSS